MRAVAHNPSGYSIIPISHSTPTGTCPAHHLPFSLPLLLPLASARAPATPPPRPPSHTQPLPLLMPLLLPSSVPAASRSSALPVPCLSWLLTLYLSCPSPYTCFPLSSPTRNHPHLHTYLPNPSTKLSPIILHTSTSRLPFKPLPALARTWSQPRAPPIIPMNVPKTPFQTQRYLA